VDARDSVSDQLGLEAVDEALGERVVVGITDRADRRADEWSARVWVSSIEVYCDPRSL
jgi:hypothetical protein